MDQDGTYALEPAERIALWLWMTHLRDNAPEKSLERWLIPAHSRVVHQVDQPRLRQRRRHRSLPFTNQIGGPEMTRPPCDRAVQEHLAIRRRHHRGEGVELLRPVRILGCATHRDLDILDAELFRERGLIEPDLRHLLRHSQIHDRR